MNYQDWLKLYIGSWPEWKKRAGFVTTKTAMPKTSEEEKN